MPICKTNNDTDVADFARCERTRSLPIEIQYPFYSTDLNAEWPTAWRCVFAASTAGTVALVLRRVRRAIGNHETSLLPVCDTRQAIHAHFPRENELGRKKVLCVSTECRLGPTPVESVGSASHATAYNHGCLHAGTCVWSHTTRPSMFAGRPTIPESRWA